ncbi:MAG TPA: DUF2238 domain-containing protein [Rhodanobacteraceae bacterium]|nr:DUF2238 domain-containing protein [Rhodanobacteraceae bacterium]
MGLRGWLLVGVLVALVVSGIAPYERGTWWMEVAPILIALPVLLATARRWPLTRLLCVLLALHALVLILGGHYTYARVPLGDWLRDGLGLMRNDYDRFGHFVQGFVPAILARELLLRFAGLRRGAWLVIVVTGVCLGFSAFYELIEWWSALIGGSAAADFLGTQGDVWDSQWDMCWALIGAVTAQLLLSRAHDRALQRLAAAPPARVGEDEPVGVA